MRCASFRDVVGLAAAGTLLAGWVSPATGTPLAERSEAAAGVPVVPGGMMMGPLQNAFAYIPAPCWTKTRVEGGDAVNPCYVCHVRSRPPNFTDDSDLQLTLSLPPSAAENPWRNLFAPAVTRVPPIGDDELLAYVRRDNYFDPDGTIALARALDPLPRIWDGEGDGRWDGYRPDAYYRFDPRGFDHRPDGTPTGWRAYTATPVPGFFATNGAVGDALIRLDLPYRQDAQGRLDARVYEVNLAIVEALLGRADVEIDPVDERTLDADLDLDGVLGRARRIAFHGRPDGTTRMRWVGRARREAEGGRAPIAVGLFPLGTEFLHSLRYLDVAAGGAVEMATRMKELRYAQKARWLGWPELRAAAAREPMERRERADRARPVLWEGDRGVFNGQGWLLQGFIEAADGRLRPQSYEESVTCVGCHGGIGATSDGMFSFTRKLGATGPGRGWGYPARHGSTPLPEPRRRDGIGEYALYLAASGGGDPLRSNDESRRTFLDEAGRPRAPRLARLRADWRTALLPSPARALALDRAYRAIVVEQSFLAGREPSLTRATEVHARAPVGQKTGVPILLDQPR